MENLELVLPGFKYEVQTRARKGGRVWHVEVGNHFEGWREITTTTSRAAAEKVRKELKTTIKEANHERSKY